MSMSLNSPVMMLPQPQEVKTPLVPDSEMSSTMASAEYKRKAGPDALAASYAKKRGTSTGLTIEDKTSLDVSSECSKELDSHESDEESDMTDEGNEYLDPFFITDDHVEAVIRFTTRPGDYEPLRAALAKSYEATSDLYKEKFKRAAGVQRSYERMAMEDFEFLRVHVAFHKNGGAVGGGGGIRRKI